MQTGARRRPARPRTRHPPLTQEEHPMNINVSRRQTLRGLAAAALLAGMIAVGLSMSKTSNPLPAAAPAAPKADDFSPYVTKDGGISLPLDYREKFLHLGTY